MTSMTAVKAQNLRLEQSYLIGALSEIKTQYEAADSRSAKIKLTKERKVLESKNQEIKEQLKDAPPAPMHPDEAIEDFIEQFQSASGDYEKTKKTFNEYAEHSPARAFELGGERLVKTEVWANLARPIMAILTEEGIPSQDRLFKADELLKDMSRDLQEELVNHIRWSSDNRMSFGGVVSRYQAKAKAEFYDENFQRYRYGGYIRERIVERVKVWIELQETEEIKGEVVS